MSKYSISAIRQPNIVKFSIALAIIATKAVISGIVGYTFLQLTLCHIPLPTLERIIQGDTAIAGLSIWRIVITLTQGSAKQLLMIWSIIAGSCAIQTLLGFCIAYLLAPKKPALCYNIVRNIWCYILCELLIVLFSIALALWLFIYHIVPEAVVCDWVSDMYTPCSAGACSLDDIGSDIYNTLLLVFSFIPSIIIITLWYVPLLYVYEMIIDGKDHVLGWWQYGWTIFINTITPLMWLVLKAGGIFVIATLLGQLITNILGWTVFYHIWSNLVTYATLLYLIKGRIFIYHTYQSHRA
jgi:hypothetical protein